MQVLIRRKGVSLRAEWDGLAKPSDKQLHYWLRTTPDAPVTNAETANPVSDILTATLITSAGVAATTAQTVRSATVVLYKGVTGSLERPADAPVLGSTTVTDANAVIVNYAAGPSANTQLIDTSVSSYELNLLRIVEITEYSTPKLVDQIRYAGHEALRFAGHDYANCYQVSDNQIIEVVKYSLNMLNVFVDNADQQALPASAVDRESTVVLRAPLPSGELFRANDASYDPAPAPTAPTHMELVTQVNDPLAHTHWSRSPKPTHFVQESQTPVEASEQVRSEAPSFILRGGRWDAPAIHGEEATRVTNEGVGTRVRPMGTRGAISFTHTNGLGRNRFTQNKAGSSESYYSYVRQPYGGYDWEWRTVYQPVAYAYEVFSGVHTDPEFAIFNYSGVWTADGSHSNWVQVDFGKVVHGIDGLLLLGDGTELHMKDVKVHINDGSGWRLHTTVSTSSRGARDIFDLEPFSARYVRLENTSNWGHDDTSLKGAELLKRGGGVE